MTMNNLLIKGDNADGLRYLLEGKDMRGKVDLIYTDPPFATNIRFTVTNGRATTISNSQRGEVAYSDRLLGREFIEYMRERLMLMRELLSERGSIYLHTDYKIGHYVKVMMDEVFGIDNFRNDISRVKCNPKNFKHIGYGNVKDMILFYTKGSNPIWHEPFEPYTDADIRKLFPKKDANGRRYTTVPIHAPGETQNPLPFKGLLPPPGRHWRDSIETLEQWDKEGLIEWSETGNPRKIIYADKREGKRMQDIWTDFKDPQYPVYPTEKNIDFIDIIVRTSSETGSIVLDPFCGSGTTLEAASRNGRTWIGMDKSDLAIRATRKRLKLDSSSLFPSDTEYVELPQETQERSFSPSVGIATANG